MTLDQAYAVLGLTPLDKHIQNQMDDNDRNTAVIAAGFRARNIGATTWMLVSAAIQMGESDVLIVSHSQDWQRKMQERMKDILQGLHFQWSWQRRNNLTALGARGHFAYFSVNTGRLNPEAKVVGNVSVHNASNTLKLKAVPFEDEVWKEKAIKRLKQPFERIHEIRMEDHSWESAAAPSRFLAYAEDDEFLFELTREGALELAQSDKTIRTKGWVPSRPPRFPIQQRD